MLLLLRTHPWIRSIPVRMPIILLIYEICGIASILFKWSFHLCAHQEFLAILQWCISFQSGREATKSCSYFTGFCLQNLLRWFYQLSFTNIEISLLGMQFFYQLSCVISSSYSHLEFLLEKHWSLCVGDAVGFTNFLAWKVVVIDI